MSSSWSRILFGDRRDPRAVLAEEFGADAPESGNPPRAALEWGRAALEDADVDPTATPAEAIRVLRRADGRRLSLSSAKFLADHLRRGR